MKAKNKKTKMRNATRTLLFILFLLTGLIVAALLSSFSKNLSLERKTSTERDQLDKVAITIKTSFDEITEGTPNITGKNLQKACGRIGEEFGEHYRCGIEGTISLSGNSEANFNAFAEKVYQAISSNKSFKPAVERSKGNSDANKYQYDELTADLYSPNIRCLIFTHYYSQDNASVNAGTVVTSFECTTEGTYNIYPTPVVIEN